MSPKWCVNFEDAAEVEAYDRKHRVHQKRAGFSHSPRISSGHTVIDLGAGTATFAIQASLAGASVHAVDVSQAMLTNAQRKAQKLVLLVSNLTGFLTYEHQDGLADFVVTKNALHILPDFGK